MRIIWASRSLLLAAGLLFAGSVSLAQDAAKIAKMASAPMLTAKTYQGTWETTNTMGQMGSISMRMDIKTIPATGKSYIKISPSGQPSGMMTLMAQMTDAAIIDDGKTMYIYVKSRKGFMKSPHRSEAGGPFTTPMQVLRQKGTSYRMVGVEKIKGVPCSIIEVNTPPLPEFRSRGITAQAILYVEKTSNKLRQIKVITSLPAGLVPGTGTAGASPAQTASTTMILMSEKINAAIPDSAFKFTPPPGVKELTVGELTGVGGASGRPPR